MIYELNKKYAMSEYDNILIWWQTHQEYDINEYCEERVYDENGNEILPTDEEGNQRDYNDYVEIVARPKELVMKDLRDRREQECFPYINRGNLWYDTLTPEQRGEFQEWYIAWLNVTETLEMPQKPIWLK